MIVHIKRDTKYSNRVGQPLAGSVSEVCGRKSFNFLGANQNQSRLQNYLRIQNTYIVLNRKVSGLDLGHKIASKGLAQAN